MPAISYTAALQVVALIATCNPDYMTQGWHAALLTIAFEVFAILFNIFAINKMPPVEGVVVIIHLFGFFAFIVIFWVGWEKAKSGISPAADHIAGHGPSDTRQPNVYNIPRH